jgi:type IV pilus assembly protein PilC
MSSFSYVAIEGDHSVRGTVEATSAEAAKASLVAKGMHVTSVKEVKSFLQGELRLRKRLKTVDLAWLARQMAVLTDAGMGLPAALGLLARQRKGKAVGNLAEKMRQELLSGSSPSMVAATHQEELGSLFVSLVAAGEQSGVLPTTLSQLADLLESRARLRKKTRAAVTYPAAVVVVTFALAIIILMVIVPIFGKMFASFGAKLPGPTLVLVNISHFLTSHWYAVPLIIAAIGAGAWASAKQQQVKYFVSYLSLRAPIVGQLISKSSLARVASTISTMMASGTDVLTVLAYAAQSTSNQVWAAVLTKAPDLLRSGQSFSQSMSLAAQSTPGTDINFEVLAQMVEVGEQSGATPNVLGHMAKSLSEEVESGLATLESSLEPLLICIVGAVVGTMIVALYLPIFHIVTVLGNQGPSGAGA